MKKIIVCYGTRPELIKMKPLLELEQNDIEFITLFTGQHKDLVKSDSIHNIEIQDGINRLDSVVASTMNIPDEVFEGVDHILVQGDTVSAYSMALVGFHRKISVIHLEAGLRTYDFENPYPEEMYRQNISRIADINLCPTTLNKQHLMNEHVSGEIYVVGNTVLDNIVDVPTSYNNTVLVTMHRRENHHWMDEWFTEISKLAKDNEDLEFIIPLHPNPNVQKHKHLLEGIKIIDPLPYDKMIDAISKCRMIISDSGGIQEEASFLNKKVIVCRKVTERPESVNLHSFMCETPGHLSELFYMTRDDYEINQPCPYGDGHSARRIVDILKQ